MSIEWNERLMSTGIPEIDEQHQELIRRLNILFEAMKRGEGREKLEETLKFLGDYARWHFGHEEACMHRHRCPAASANKSAHRKFLEIFAELVERLESEPPTPALAVEAQSYMTQWIREHIIRVDTQLRSCVGTEKVSV